MKKKKKKDTGVNSQYVSILPLGEKSSYILRNNLITSLKRI